MILWVCVIRQCSVWIWRYNSKLLLGDWVFLAAAVLLQFCYCRCWYRMYTRRTNGGEALKWKYRTWKRRGWKLRTKKWQTRTNSTCALRGNGTTSPRCLHGGESMIFRKGVWELVGCGQVPRNWSFFLNTQCGI